MNEALFNLVNVWSLMLWPLMLADKKGVKVKNKFGWYLGTQVQYMPQQATASTGHVTNRIGLFPIHAPTFPQHSLFASLTVTCILYLVDRPFLLNSSSHSAQAQAACIPTHEHLLQLPELCLPVVKR